MRIAAITKTVVSSIQQGFVGHWLNANESATFRSFDSSVATDWLAGRVALKQAYIDFSRDPVVPSELAVTNSFSGVPSINERSEISCSISHSAGWGVAGVSHQPIGVDIEKIKTRSGQLLHYVSTDDELADMMDHEEPDTLLTEVWAMKEAALKAWRTGLEVPPRSVRLRRHRGDTFTAQCVARRFLPTLNVVVYGLGDFVFAVAFMEALNGSPIIHWLDIPGVSTSQHAVLPR